MSNTIMVAGDDGSVYKVKPKDIQKVAKKVSVGKLSPDVQSHVAKAAGKGTAHIFASKADIFVASKADIFVAGKSDLLGASKADIFVSAKKKASAAKADIFVAKKKTPAPKADIFVAGKEEK